MSKVQHRVATREPLSSCAPVAHARPRGAAYTGSRVDHKSCSWVGR